MLSVLYMLQPLHLAVRDCIRHPCHLLGHCRRHSSGPQVQEGAVNQRGERAQEEAKVNEVDVRREWRGDIGGRAEN